MTSLADRSRVPAGVRTGGQFATEARGESDVTLAPPADHDELTTNLEDAEQRLADLTADREGWRRDLVDAEAGGWSDQVAQCEAGLAAIEADIAEATAEVEQARAALAATSPAAPGDVSLALAPHQDLPSVEDSVAKLTEQWADRAFAPAAAAEQARRDVEQAQRFAGDDVPAEYVAALLASAGAVREPNDYGHGGPFGPSGWANPGGGEAIRDAYATGMPADWPEQMAARGEGWRTNCVNRWNDGLTDRELERLARMGMDGDPRIAHAYIGCNLFAVRDWIKAATDDQDFSRYLGRYLSHAGVGRYVREGVPLEHVRLCHELSQDPNNAVEPGLALRGLTRPDGTVEKGPDAIRELVDYAKAAGRSTDEAHEGIRLGVPAKDVKAFGPKVEPKEIPAFQDAGVPAKVARSLRARDRQITPEFAARLHEAGISSGADYKEWSTVGVVVEGGMGRPKTSRTDWDAVLPVAKVGVPVELARDLRARGVPVSSIAEVHSAGITDLQPWLGALHARTQTTMPMARREEIAMSAISAFAKAGGTPEQLRRIQRAGIPLADAHEHVDTDRVGLWLAGGENRHAAMTEEARRAAMWGRDRSSGQSWDVDGADDL